MSDIYEQKAKKYKYKYLKLKKQYIAKGGGWEDLNKIFEPLVTPVMEQVKQVTKQIEQFVKPVSQLVLLHNINYEIEFIGYGTYGCIISPPLQFNNNNNINIKFNTNINNIFTSKEYVGKLLSCDNNAFNDEYEQFINIEKIDKDANHRSKLIFAAYMSTEELKENLIFLCNNLQNEKTKKQIKQLYKCLINPEKQIINSSISKNYGYIISTRVGKSFKYHKLYEFKTDEIITILENLKESIGDLIQKLYDDEYIHGDIKFDNMTLDENLKVYFIDFGFMQKYYELDNLKTSSHQYPEILNIFLKIKNKFKNYKEEDDDDDDDDDDDEKEFKKQLKNQTLNKEELINLLKKYQQEKINSIQSNLLIKTQLNFIDYSRFFESLEDNLQYSFDDYTKCIEPIAKNIDIYALSLYIYKLFYNFFDKIQPFNYFKTSNNFRDYIINLYNSFKKNNTLKILNELLINALYNNIDGPEELIIYIEAIINSIKNSTYTILYKKIEDRRKIKEILFYYYFSDKYIDSNYIYNNYK